MNFAKFLRTPFLQNTSGQRLLYLLGNCLIVGLAVLCRIENKSFLWSPYFVLVISVRKQPFTFRKIRRKKSLCQGLFLINSGHMIAALQPVTLLKRDLAQKFSSEVCKIVRSSLLRKRPQGTVSKHFKNMKRLHFIWWRQVCNSRYPFTEGSSHQGCSTKNVFIEVSQNSQGNTCDRVSFLIKLQASGLQLY